MTPYKFKGLLKNGKGWVYGMPTYDFEYIFNENDFDSPDNYEVIPETVTLFTGLLDMKGNEIYRNDRMKALSGELSTVKWAEDLCRYVLIFDEPQEDSVFTFLTKETAKYREVIDEKQVCLNKLKH
jgi:hypothetical protein